MSNPMMTLSAQELQARSKVPLTVLPDVQQTMEHCARSIADEIKAHNAQGQPTRLILPVGPVRQYPILLEITHRERISWKNVWVFHMDDYLDWQCRPVPQDHPLCFEGFMRQQFYTQMADDLAIPAEQVLFPSPLAMDLPRQRMDELGGVDTCYGGIGVHGHLAFNEPPISRYYEVSLEEFRHSRTRIVPIEPETVTMNSIRNLGGDTTVFPPLGITLGMGELLSAQRMRFYAPGGEWQRMALRTACLGEVSVRYPCTLLQEHPDAAIIADAVTAAPHPPSLW
ncbi:MAG: glucosamine-6-phosphate isomerase [Chloroflexi bacterium]|nr:glucosamine-6-phosphate isomerase [Chloroflexota bacterium]